MFINTVPNPNDELANRWILFPVGDCDGGNPPEGKKVSEVGGNTLPSGSVRVAVPVIVPVGVKLRKVSQGETSGESILREMSTVPSDGII